MKKRILMAAVLLVGGLLTTTSCLDDKESASVENVRNAKAAQLNALATLYNSQAEAAKITAEAEAALNMAKAAAEEADAEFKRIQNEIEKLKLQIAEATYDLDLQAALANAEAELAKAQKNKETALSTLETNRLTLEKNLWIAKTGLLQAETDYKKAIINADAAEVAYYKSIVSAYTTAVKRLTDAEWDLYNKKVALVEAENKLKEVPALIAEKIEELENKNVVAEAKIEALKKYTNYVEDVDKLEAEQEELKQVLDYAMEAQDIANRAYWDAVNDIELPDVSEALGEKAYAKAYDALFYDIYELRENNHGWPYNAYFEDRGNEEKEVEFEEGFYRTRIYLYSAVEVNIEKVKTYVPQYTNALKAAEDNPSLKQAKDDLNDAKAETTKAKTKWDDEAKKTSPDPALVQQYAEEYRTALQTQEWRQQNVETYEKMVTDAKEKLAQLNTIISDYTKFAKEVDAYNDEYVAAYTPSLKLYVTYLTKQAAVKVIDEEIAVINKILNDNTGYGSAKTLAAAIDTLKDEIAANDKAIAEWRDIYPWNDLSEKNLEAARKQAVEMAKNDVVKAELEVELAKAEVTSTKAAMDTVLEELKK